MSNAKVTPIPVTKPARVFVSKPTLVGTTGKSKAETPGVFMMIDVNEILVDAKYQRTHQLIRSRKMAKNWDWRLFKVISVAQRADGTYFAYDGQHSVSAARLAGITVLPCFVFQSDTVGEEAVAFVKMNRERMTINSLDSHNASVIGEDPIAVRIAAILKEYGVEPVRGAAGVRRTTGIANIRNQYARLQDMNDADERLRTTLKVVEAAWGDEAEAYSGQFIRGVWRFVSSIENRALLLADASKRLGRHPVKDLLYKATFEAKVLGVHISQTIPKVLLAQFNYKVRKNRLV